MSNGQRTSSLDANFSGSSYSNSNYSQQRTSDQQGCQAIADGRRCGETKNLQIIQEFKRMYETKMKQIDDAAGGDCIQAKINLQQEWIKDLTDQNEMLVRVVEELEVEAAERVNMLEDRLQNSAKCACEQEKTLKEKDIKIKELEEKVQKLSETAEMVDEARLNCQRYAELRKAEEETAKIEKLCQENNQLGKEVKILKQNISKMKTEVRPKQLNSNKEIQTTKVNVFGQISYINLLKNMTHTAKKALVGNLENEVQSMLKQIDGKDKQLYDQNELIMLLVQKLFFVYKTLRHLDEETMLMIDDLQKSCRCNSTQIAERYEEIILTLQSGLRKSIKGIEDKCDQ